MTSLDAQLDALLAAHRAPIEEVKAKTFDEILEAAELLSQENPNGIEQVLKDAALARLNPVQAGLVMRKIKAVTKVPLSDIKTMFLTLNKDAKKAFDEDYGRSLATSTLNRFFAAGEHLTFTNGSFYAYASTHWVRRDEAQVANLVNATLIDMPSPEGMSHSAALSQAMQLLKVILVAQEDVFRFSEEPRPIINVKNGELHIDPTTGGVLLKPHDPKSYLTYVLDVEYDPFAVCPLYDATLLRIWEHSSSPHDMARHWNEFVGYAIQPVRDIASWWMLKGHGSNGKTQLMSTITKLMGPSSVASIKVQTLAERFGLSPLVGKLMALDDDVDTGIKLPDGMLKMISERKLLQAEYKGKDAFNFVSTALPVMLCNNFPATSDVSHGMMRRAYVFPFTRQFEGAEVDRTLFPRIWATELPGILNRALAGLTRLKERGNFDVPKDCRRAVEVWLNAANPVKAFLDEEFEEFSEGRIPLKEFYKKYQSWAVDAGVRHTLGRNTIKRTLENLKVRFVTRKGYVYVAGLGYRQQQGLAHTDDE